MNLTKLSVATTLAAALIASPAPPNYARRYVASINVASGAIGAKASEVR